MTVCGESQQQLDEVVVELLPQHFFELRSVYGGMLGATRICKDSPFAAYPWDFKGKLKE